MSLKELLVDGRVSKNMTAKQLALLSGIDIALISKYESLSRIPSKTHLDILIDILGLDPEEANAAWLAEKVYKILDDDASSLTALNIAEARIRYGIDRKVKVNDTFSQPLKELLESCDELKLKWNSIRPLNATQLRKMEEYFNLNYTYESNRIEGNTLTLQETHLVINEGITIGGRSVREHLEAVNHAEAIGFISEIVKEKTPFTERILKQLHYLVLKGIDRDNAGVYRSVGVRISGSSHVPPEPFLLQRLMEGVFEYYQENKSILHPIVLAAEMHERIVRIHPFIDGNGRTTRLVMNLVLLQNGFPIANIKGDTATRMEYYGALEKAASDKEDFYLLIAKAVLHSLNEHIELSQ